MNSSITNTILWATIEDFAGLWEILWEVNISLSDKNETQNKELTKETLTHFLNKGFVKCYRSTWGIDDLVEISSTKAIEFLDEENYWQPPKLDDPCLKFGCTEEGEVYYKKN